MKLLNRHERRKEAAEFRVLSHLEMDKATPEKTNRTQHRNCRCACDSGKKFKNCCIK